MDHFAGLDVSVKETSVCIVDDTGRIVREAKVASEPDALLQVLTNGAYRFKRIGLEAGPLSQWLFDGYILDPASAAVHARGNDPGFGAPVRRNGLVSSGVHGFSNPPPLVFIPALVAVDIPAKLWRGAGGLLFV